MKDSSIPVVDNIKFLGLIFDKKLSWVPHINQLVVTCKKSLNIIKCLSNIFWGSDSKLLVTLLQSLVLSKLDYGCSVYSSARNSYLKLLDTILTSGLRYATGAFRTSPASSLQSYCGLLPLNLRRDRFTLRYFHHVLSTHKHPNRSLFTNSSLTDKYQQHPTRTRPVGFRAHELIQALDIPSPKFFKNTFFSILPWSVPPPDINLEFSQYKKQDLHPAHVQRLYHEITSPYVDFTHVFTDGSKTQSGVGCSVIVDKHCSRSWRLSSLASVYTAELYALWQAVLYCSSSTDSSFIICSDSLSSLQSLLNTFSDDPLVQLLLNSYQLAVSKSKKIVFCFIPSHVGIKGNEQADLVAVTSTTKHQVDDDRLRPGDMKQHINQCLNMFWSQVWSNSNSKLRLVKPDTKSLLSVSTSLSRHHSVVLCRLVIGHTRLTHNHVLLNSPHPHCSCSNHVAISVEHLLLSCPLYSLHRHLLDTSSGLVSCLSHQSSN
jgi:ribonuclease HI